MYACRRSASFGRFDVLVFRSLIVFSHNSSELPQQPMRESLTSPASRLKFHLAERTKAGQVHQVKSWRGLFCLSSGDRVPRTSGSKSKVYMYRYYLTEDTTPWGHVSKSFLWVGENEMRVNNGIIHPLKKWHVRTVERWMHDTRIKRDKKKVFTRHGMNERRFQENKSAIEETSFFNSSESSKQLYYVKITRRNAEQ